MSYVGKEPQPKFLGQVDDLTVAGDVNVDTNTLVVDSANNLVGIGTSSPSEKLQIQEGASSTLLLGYSDGVGVGYRLRSNVSTTLDNGFLIEYNDGTDLYRVDHDGGTGFHAWYMGGSEHMRIDSDGRLLVGKTSSNYLSAGFEVNPVTSTSSSVYITKNTTGAACLYMLRTSASGDGAMIYFAQNSTTEGNISVSGTTVSYNGGHLSRWSQLTDGTKDETIVKGTVLTNLDQMAIWHHEATEDKEAYTEDNEQLNCMAVSSVEGDTNVAGVFVNWDNDDEDGFNDMNIAMTGDMVIRIAQGITVQRGDLLMSAGDGTAKPQGDDIVRSKTIAKVTSTHVSHTYDDGSYLVPCVVMAC